MKIKKIKPMFNSLITTMDKYEKDEYTDGGIIDTTKLKGTLKEYQKVIAVGGTVREIKPGDMVCINPTRFGVKKHQEGSLKDGVITDNPVITYNFDIVEMNGEPFLLLQDRDIHYIIEEYEDENKVDLIVPKQKIIV